MARFSGLVGFALTERIRPGVSEERIVEKGPYFGDVKRAAMSANQSDSVNTDLRTTNTIEIVADAFASQNFFAIRYVVWAGTPWFVTEVTIQRPRLLLQLGGVYSAGRTTSEASDTP